jgi:formate dehydrogenase alpha subunit
VVAVTTAADAPVNGRALCVKGRFHTDMIHSPERLTTPLIRKNGVLDETSWDEALDLIARLRGRHATPTAVTRSQLSAPPAAPTKRTGSCRSSCRAVMRTNNLDHCART